MGARLRRAERAAATADGRGCFEVLSAFGEHSQAHYLRVWGGRLGTSLYGTPRATFSLRVKKRNGIERRSVPRLRSGGGHGKLGSGLARRQHCAYASQDGRLCRKVGLPAADGCVTQGRKGRESWAQPPHEHDRSEQARARMARPASTLDDPSLPPLAPPVPPLAFSACSACVCTTCRGVHNCAQLSQVALDERSSEGALLSDRINAPSHHAEALRREGPAHARELDATECPGECRSNRRTADFLRACACLVAPHRF